MPEEMVTIPKELWRLYQNLKDAITEDTECGLEYFYTQKAFDRIVEYEQETGAHLPV
jgi:hypothetical protein